MTPIILFDLLAYHPACIKVFCSNFYLSRRPYHEYYSPHRLSPLEGWAHHDLCSQVNFVRNLYANGVVEFDKESARALRMSNTEYLRCMERLDRGAG